MFHITLTPQRSDVPLTASVAGSVLTLNDTPVDLATYEVGASPWIVGQPEEVAGVWHVTLILPHGGKAPAETLFPVPVLVMGDGDIVLPPYDAPDVADVADD